MLSIERTQDGPFGIILNVAGTIDQKTAATLKSGATLDRHVRSLRLDLRSAAVSDSAGLGAVIASIRNQAPTTSAVVITRDSNLQMVLRKAGIEAIGE